MNSLEAAMPAVAAEALCDAFEVAYLEHLEALDLEDRLAAGLRASDLGDRLCSLGLQRRVQEIQAELRAWS